MDGSQFFMFDGAKNMFGFLPIREDFFYEYRYMVASTVGDAIPHVEITIDSYRKPLCFIAIWYGYNNAEIEFRITNQLSYSFEYTYLMYLDDDNKKSGYYAKNGVINANGYTDTDGSAASGQTIMSDHHAYLLLTKVE